MEIASIFQTFLVLQLFADGGTGTGGATGGAGGTGATVAASQTGAVTEAAETATTETVSASQTEAVDRVAKFEALIKGDYKDLYDARVRDTVQRRLRESKETEEAYQTLRPSIDLLAKRYGVDAKDAKALSKAIEEDESFYQDEAMRTGVPVEHIKAFRKVERENAQLREQMEAKNRQENAEKIYSEWVGQAEKAKAVYPSLDLATEIQNPQFADLLRNGIDVQTAYMVIHKDEIIPAAMSVAAQKAVAKTVNSIATGGQRVQENGLSQRSGVVRSSDVSKLTKAQREEYIRRAASGEKITFG